MRLFKRYIAYPGLGLLVIAAIAVNTPLASVGAQAIGRAGESLETNPRVDACNQPGFSLSGDLTILPSPASFDPGPRGEVLWSTARAAAAGIVHPVWYVTANPDGAFMSTCDGGSNSITNWEVGRNLDRGQELHVVGVPKQPVPWVPMGAST